jgi:hypothetical protein
VSVARNNSFVEVSDFVSFIKWSVSTVGILDQTGVDAYGFSHLGIEEYFAALHLAENADRYLATLAARIDDLWWFEVIANVLSLRDRNISEPFMRLAITEANLIKNESVLAELIRIVDRPPREQLLAFARQDSIESAARAAAERLLRGNAFNNSSSFDDQVEYVASNNIVGTAIESLAKLDRDTIEVGLSNVAIMRFRHIPGGGKCCKDLILPKNPDFARKPPCLSASQSTTGFSAKSRRRGDFRQNRKVATLPYCNPFCSEFSATHGRH